MTWKMTNSQLDPESLLLNESLLSLGNGYLGVRGNFEEGYREGYKTIRGTYINAFHDEVEIKYGEKLHAFPDIQQKLLNVIDGQRIEIYIDDERFSLFEGEVVQFDRKLHMDSGFSERSIHWKSPTGKEIKLTFKRLISFHVKELFAIDVEIQPIRNIEKVKVVSIVEGDVSNFVDSNDPRVAAGHAKRLHIAKVYKDENYSVIKNRTYVTNLEVAAVTHTAITIENYHYESNMNEHRIEEIYQFEGNKTVHFTKYNVYTDTLRHGEDVIDKGIEIQQELSGRNFQELLQEQKAYLDQFWHQSDVKIEGDMQLQEGIRFNLYQLLQSVGKDSVSNIAAKGLSGEGYEGHYFWDTEIYMLPVFLMTHPEIAKKLLLHRYSLLESARKRAREMGHKKGALFPWRTITGQESSAFFPAGTAQYHISADIAYSYIQYYLVTKDEAFLKEYMAEMLFETARLWNDTGHMLDGEFRIDSVTGPDEYTCIVNNNYYTNVMAKYNLSWAVKVFHQLKEENEIDKLMVDLNLTENEVAEWTVAAENMYLPYDEELKINAQDDSFLQKMRWDLKSTPEEKFPLLLNYHPLTLYRYQVIKQADTVLAHFLLEDEQDIETIKNSFDYYEALTTHDSSLSCSIYGIMASKLGYKEKAYQYFIDTARLDLDNTQGNTKDGLHMANMGGTWLAIVYGFVGLRVKEDGLHFAPALPEAWDALSFKLQYQGRVLKIELTSNRVAYTILEGNALTIAHKGKSVMLEKGKSVEMQ